MQEEVNKKSIIQSINSKLNHVQQKRFRDSYYEALFNGQPSFQVEAKCCDCCGWHRIERGILDCKGFGCPNYFVRPFQYEDTQLLRIELKKHFLTKENKG